MLSEKCRDRRNRGSSRGQSELEVASEWRKCAGRARSGGRRDEHLARRGSVEAVDDEWSRPKWGTKRTFHSAETGLAMVVISRAVEGRDDARSGCQEDVLQLGLAEGREGLGEDAAVGSGRGRAGTSIAAVDDQMLVGLDRQTTRLKGPGRTLRVLPLRIDRRHVSLPAGLRRRPRGRAVVRRTFLRPRIASCMSKKIRPSLALVGQSQEQGAATGVDHRIAVLAADDHFDLAAGQFDGARVPRLSRVAGHAGDAVFSRSGVSAEAIIRPSLFQGACPTPGLSL